MVTVVSGIRPERSVCQGWQGNGGIIAQGSDGFQGQITGALDGPLVILLEKNGADGAVLAFTRMAELPGLLESVVRA